MDKLKKLAGAKYILLAFIFMATIVVTFISMNFEYMEPVATTMDDASLPIVAFVCDDREINSLHGYTGDVDEVLINDTLTPLDEGRKLDFVVHTYGEEVDAISYKIRNRSDGSLIENTKISQYFEDGDNIYATMNIKNLIEDNTEYTLQVIISNKKHSEISYYTNIINGGPYYLNEKIDFVMDFNSATFDKSRLEDIKVYLETSSKNDNTNLGNVNIFSSLEQVGWGELEPFIQSDIVPEVKLLSDELAVICLNYTVGAVNQYESSDTYRVNESYRIRRAGGGTMYLLNYERQMNQVFDGKNDLNSKGFLNLGITSKDDVEMKADTEGNYTYFENEGSLWCYDNLTNVYTRVFSFTAEDTDNLRENYDNHIIKIIDVEENGDCSFIVEGYMNRGKREGQVGVSLYVYSYSDNQVDEKLFIPVNVPFEFLVENVGTIAYMTDGGTFYICIDGVFYSVDLTSKEVMNIASGLTNGAYAVSSDGEIVAYNMNGTSNSADSVRIMNMETGNQLVIDAGEDEYIKTLGFVNSDFVYGLAKKADVETNSAGDVTFAMYKIVVLDSDYNVLKEYSQDGIYVDSVKIDGMRVTMNRVVKSEELGYQNTTIDQLINKDENSVANKLYLDTISTDLRKRELCIGLINKVKSLYVTYRTSGEVLYNDNDSIVLNDVIEGGGKYYAYSFGSFITSTESLEEAIQLANDGYGYVLDNNSNVVWRRYKRTSGAISGLSVNTSGSPLANAVDVVSRHLGLKTSAEEKLNQGTSAADILSGNSYAGMSINGVSIDKLLSFVDIGCPLIVRTGAEDYGVVVAYDAAQITFIDASNGNEITISVADANELFTKWGNTFVAYYGLTIKRG
ncbi:MAG: hypothetical protein ACI4E1_04570 [Lachnospira sp.]